MNSTVDSNTVGLAIAEESSLQTLPGTPVFYELAPNSFSNFGADYKTVARNPIKKDRQRKKGVVVDMDANGAFDMDVTDSITSRLLQGFFFADARQKASTKPMNGTQVVLTAATASDKSVSAASGLTVFKAKDRVLLSGFANAANNGVKTVATATATKLTFVEAMVDEAPTANAVVDCVGYAAAAGDLTLTTGTEVQYLNSTALNFTTLGLTVGEYIFIGGDTTASTFATVIPGYARISAITATRLTFDDTTFTAASDTGAGKTIELYFGTVLRNEKDAALIKRRSYHLERQLGSDGAGAQAEYLKGAIANEFTLNLSEASKIDANLSYIALGHSVRSTGEGALAGTRIASVNEDAYNTSTNIFRTKVYMKKVLNAPAMYGWASELKLSIKNGIKANKALAVLGGFEATAGSFEVSANLEVYFSSVTALLATPANEDIQLNTILTKSNRGFIFDLPKCCVSGGQPKVDKDNPIKVSLTLDAGECDAGYTLMNIYFPYLPTAAMAK